MSNKTQFNARVRHKTGKYADWEQAANSFKPLLGEIIVYIPNDANDTRSTRLKVGDGEHFINELDFITNPEGGGNAPGGALNQIQSNWNQKDNKQVDFIKNKPFDKEEEILYWDGNLTNNNVIQVDTNMWICKITNTAPSLEELNKTIVMSSADNLFVEQVEITEENIDTSMFPGVTAILIQGSPIMAIVEQDIEYQGLSLSAGTWFFYVADSYYTKWAKISKIKYLDPEVIPNMYRETGTKITWDNQPTNTAVYPGYFVEWDGNLLDTKPYINMVVPVDLPNGVPAGSTVQLQKVDEKLISLENYYFDVYYPLSESTDDYFIETDDIQKMYDSNNNLIATHSADGEIWNVEQPGIINFAGIEIEFIEAGLYFACVPGMVYVTALYDENIYNVGPIAWYRISDPLNLLTLHGSKINIDMEGQNFESIFNYDAQGQFEVPVIDTGTGSSISIYAFNIVNDNEIVDLTDQIGCQFTVPKAGFYLIDIAYVTEGNGYFNYFLGSDYNIIKIDKKFLPDELGSSLFTGVFMDTSSMNGVTLNTSADLIFMDYMKMYVDAFVIRQDYQSMNPSLFSYSIPDLDEFYLQTDTLVVEFANDKEFDSPVIAIASEVGNDMSFINTNKEINIMGTFNPSKPATLRCVNFDGIYYGYLVDESGISEVEADSYVSSSSTNPIQSKAIYAALGNRTSLPTISSTVSSGSSNIMTSGGVYTALGNRTSLPSISSSVTSGSSSLITSGGVYSALQNVKVTTDTSISSTSTNPIQSKAIYTALGNRTKLEFDTTPTENSSKLLTSGNVYTALQNIDIEVDDIITETSNNPVSSVAIHSALKNVNAAFVNGYRFNVSDTPPVEGEVDDYTITFVI